MSACARAGLATLPTSMTVDDGQQLLDTRVVAAVHCAPPEKYLRTIAVGSDQSGATVMVDNSGKLIVEFVRVRNLNGFSGDFNRGLGGNDASVTLNDNTYQIAGAATGYGPDSPELTTTRFTMKVSC